MIKVSLIITFFIGFCYISKAQTVTIGTQVWMTKNLDVSTFRNGDSIPQVNTNEDWVKAREKKQPAWCYYENDPANGAKYGKLYNWYAVNDPRGLAPKGYHIPTDAEWKKLAKSLGGNKKAGEKMKITEEYGTNSSGFSGLLGGMGTGYEFNWKGGYGFWWSATEANEDQAKLRFLRLSDINLGIENDYKGNGFSVRCLRD